MRKIEKKLIICWNEKKTMKKLFFRRKIEKSWSGFNIFNQSGILKKRIFVKMVVKLDFNECLRDSPFFRKNLTKAESDLESFETIYKKVIFYLTFVSFDKYCIKLYVNDLKDFFWPFKFLSVFYQREIIDAYFSRFFFSVFFIIKF